MRQISYRTFQIIAIGCLLQFPKILFAETITLTLPAIDAGFITAEGGAAKFDALLAPPAKFNYSAGREKHYPGGGLKPFLSFGELKEMDKKNYFVFDLSDVATPITSATLLLPMPVGGYTSSAASEDYALAGTSVSADEVALLSTVVIPEDVDAEIIALATDLYGLLTESLTTIPAFATTSVSAADAGAMLELVLSGEGVDYLNLALGTKVVLGGTLTSVSDDAALYDPQEVFSGTAPSLVAGDATNPKLLITTVPLPSALLLFIPGLAGIGLFSRQLNTNN